MQMPIGPDPSQHQIAARLPKWVHKAVHAICTSAAELRLFPLVCGSTAWARLLLLICMHA